MTDGQFDDHGDASTNPDALRDAIKQLEAENETLRERVAELEELEARVAALEEQPDVEFRGDDREMTDLWIGGFPFGRLVDNHDKQLSTLKSIFLGKQGIGDFETLKAAKDVLRESLGPVADYLTTVSDPRERGPDVDRGAMLPAHQMVFDLQTERELPIGQHRAAVLFRQFTNYLLKGRESAAVDGGQMLHLNSNQAERALLDADILDVKKQSRPRVVARAMREVQTLTKREECDCDDIDDCTHGLVVFRPGKPHQLATSKAEFKQYMERALDLDIAGRKSESDTSVSTTTDEEVDLTESDTDVRFEDGETDDLTLSDKDVRKGSGLSDINVRTEEEQSEAEETTVSENGSGEIGVAKTDVEARIEELTQAERSDADD